MVSLKTITDNLNNAVKAGSPNMSSFPLGAFGTVPAGGVMILRIYIVFRSHGTDLVIATDDVVITVSIP